MIFIMKKFIVIFALFALILPSCTEKNKPEEEISDKPKYLIEISSTSIPGEGYDTNVADTGLVYRYVYERETNPKYLTSYSLYSKDKLQTKIEYTNEGDSQYGEVTYVDNGDDFTVGSNRMSGEKDTTIYLDEERTLIKEEKSPSSHMIVEYDEKNRIISRVIVYNNGGESNFEYKYIGNVRYGIGKWGDNTRTVLYYNTVEYVNSIYDDLHMKRQMTHEIVSSDVEYFFEDNYEFVGGKRSKNIHKTIYIENGVRSEHISEYSYTWLNNNDYQEKSASRISSGVVITYNLTTYKYIQ